ncbi:hypothetical protein [Paenibacillus sp. 22594]|uniref:hypothetical protein n=1 Tax=Paenibacillus sp. 22594 TaxID=3453947 RepID=UPI003F871DF9
MAYPLIESLAHRMVADPGRDMPGRSSTESTVYRISGGAFTKKGDTHEGRLEFLQLPGSQECI